MQNSAHSLCFNMAPISSQTIPSWTPADTTTSLWLDFTDSNTIFIGTGISQINDKSGNGRHFTQSTTDKQPALISSALNGKSVARFDGVNDYLRIANNYDFGSNVTLFFVLRYTNSSQDGLFDSGPNVGNVLRQANGYVEWWNTDPYLALNAPVNTYFLLTLIYSLPSGRVLEKYINDTDYAIASSANTNSAAWTSLTFGTINNSGNPFNGDIAELLICPGVITTDIRNRLNGYAAYRYGLQSSLAANHPYKNSPP